MKNLVFINIFNPSNSPYQGRTQTNPENLNRISITFVTVLFLIFSGLFSQKAFSTRKTSRDVIEASIRGNHDFSGWDLRGANLSDSNIRRSLPSPDFSNADLRGASFRGTWLYNANFSNADLRNVNFSEDGLNRTRAENVNFRGANLAGANFSEAILMGSNFKAVNLSGLNFKKASLSGTILVEANLKGANLTQASLAGANLSDADLKGANLTSATLQEANLTKANLREANLSRANLKRANLYLASLVKADLRWAQFRSSGQGDRRYDAKHLSKASLGGAKFNRRTKFPDGFRGVKHDSHYEYRVGGIANKECMYVTSLN